MQLSHRFAAGMLVAALSASQPVLAAGNVLLPSSNASTTTATPNLGIAVPVATSAPAPSPIPTPAAPYLPADTAVAPQTAGQSVPAPASGKPGDILTLVDPESAKHLDPKLIPTQLLHMPDTSATATALGGNLPFTLTIAFSSQSIFGSKDVQDINTKLGLTRDKIASTCYLTAGGLVQTDTGSYIIIGGGNNPQAIVHYSGTVKSYMMAGQASCATPAKLPPGSGYLTDVNGRINIPLQPIKCDAPTRQASTLTITYDGSGTSKCAYQ